MANPDASSALMHNRRELIRVTVPTAARPMLGPLRRAFRRAVRIAPTVMLCGFVMCLIFSSLLQLAVVHTDRHPNIIYLPQYNLTQASSSQSSTVRGGRAVAAYTGKVQSLYNSNLESVNFLLKNATNQQQGAVNVSQDEASSKTQNAIHQLRRMRLARKPKAFSFPDPGLKQSTINMTHKNIDPLKGELTSFIDYK